MTLLILSLLLNIVVLLPVGISLARDAAWTHTAYGEDTPARRILLAIYIAIAVGSALLLVVRDPSAVVALLFVQIIYKVASLFLVGDIRNPVVASNLAIAVFHTATLLWLYLG
jgi:hypothetical protein